MITVCRWFVAVFLLIVAYFAFLLFVPYAEAHAEEPIEVYHVPEGIRLEVDGVEYMVYDFNTFLDLVELDRRHSACLEESDTLQARLTSLSEAYEESGRLFLELQEEYDRLSSEYVDALSSRPHQFLHPIHTPIEVVLAGSLAATLYALTKD